MTPGFGTSATHAGAVLALSAVVACERQASAASIEPAVRATCDSIAAKWRAIAGVTVREADSTGTPMSESSPVRGCAVIADSRTGVDSVRMATTYWSAAEGRQWLPLTQWMADGPDGGTLTWEARAIRCEVRTEVDGGDDADTTYVPAPWLIERTLCWSFGGEPTRADSATRRPSPAAGALIRAGRRTTR